jgi:hypothetical protein
MGTIFWGVGSPGTASVTANGGRSSAIVGVSGAQVVAGNPARQRITFSNPGVTNVFVFPLLNATGGVNSPNSGNPAGSFQLLSGSQIVIAGECQGAWGAFGASATNYLTIMESNL